MTHWFNLGLSEDPETRFPETRLPEPRRLAKVCLGKKKRFLKIVGRENPRQGRQTCSETNKTADHRL